MMCIVRPASPAPPFVPCALVLVVTHKHTKTKIQAGLNILDWRMLKLMGCVVAFDVWLSVVCALRSSPRISYPKRSVSHADVVTLISAQHVLLVFQVPSDSQFGTFIHCLLIARRIGMSLWHVEVA